MKVLSWRVAVETKFRNIYNLYKNDLFRLAISYTKNVSDAEDVIQEVFIKLYKNITDLHNDEHIKYWLIVTTINTCKNLNKSYWKRNIRSINEIDVSKELNNNEILDELFKLPNKLCAVYLSFNSAKSLGLLFKFLSIVSISCFIKFLFDSIFLKLIQFVK